MAFSFETPSSAPATTGLTGFSFGANKPAAPGFGLTATSQPSTGLFGTPATSAPAFGTGTSTFGTKSAFGATSTAPAFGTTTPAFGAAAPAFGATSAPAFGANTSFGAASTAPAFGTTSLSFGTSTAAPAFGTTTSAFGATTTPAFGASNTSFGLGTGLFGATTTASTGLSFGTTTTASTGLGGLGGFGFGTTTTQSGLGLFGSTSTVTTSGNNTFGNINVTGKQPYTSATPSLGLGGVAQVGSANATTADGKSELPKQTKLPNEISTTVDSFKEFVKKQKSLSSDVMRANIKPLHKVGREAESMLRSVLTLRAECGRSRAQSLRLRAAAAAALAAAEIAARDYPGSDPEGLSPPTYVKDLISELEQQLITFRRQMDVADKQMQSTPKLLTEQEVTLGIRRMHESLVALAARLQAVHTQVEGQKEQYLNLRKYILKDPSNVFETPSTSASLDRILRDAEGTKKHSKSGHLTEIGLGSAVLSDPRAALGNIHQLAGPTPFSYLGSTLSSFPTADNTGTNWQPQPQASLNTSLNMPTFGSTQNESGFQLQKPPGKRGKQ